MSNYSFVSKDDVVETMSKFEIYQAYLKKKDSPESEAEVTDKEKISAPADIEA